MSIDHCEIIYTSKFKLSTSIDSYQRSAYGYSLAISVLAVDELFGLFIYSCI